MVCRINRSNDRLHNLLYNKVVLKQQNDDKCIIFMNECKLVNFAWPKHLIQYFSNFTYFLKI